MPAGFIVRDPRTAATAPYGLAASRRVEGVHGEAKTQHGLRRAVRRGMGNVAIQVYLTAAVMNLKRLAAFACAVLWRFVGFEQACDVVTRCRRAGAEINARTHQLARRAA